MAGGRSVAAPASPVAAACTDTPRAQRPSRFERLSRSAVVADCDGSRRREAWFAALVYAILTAWWLWPLPTGLSSQLLYPAGSDRGSTADIDLILWGLAWGSHALMTQPLHLFDANIFHPAPLALAFSEHFLGHQVVFFPVYAISENPLLSANAVVVFAQWSSAFFAFLFARRFVGGPAAFVSGMAFGFIPARLRTLGHFHLLAVQWIPLSLYYCDRLLASGRRRDALGVAVSVGIQLLTSFYLAYALVLSWAAALPWLLLRWRRRLAARQLLWLGLALVVGALPFLLAARPYLYLREIGLIPQYDDLAGDSTGQVGLIPTLALVTAWGALQHWGTSRLLLGMALLGLLTALRPRMRTGALCGMALLALGWFVARGPAPLQVFGQTLPAPFVLLQQIVPGFDAIRLPLRMLVIAYLGIALLAGLGSELFLARLGHRMAWAGALGVGALGLFLQQPGPELALHGRLIGAASLASTQWLRDHADGRPLFEVPALPGFAFAASAARMLQSTRHWLPLLGGYSAYVPPIAPQLLQWSRELPDPAALERLLAKTDIGWILVHLDQLTKEARQRWEERPVADVYEVAAELGSDLILRVKPRGVAAAASPLYARDHTADGLLRSPIVGSCRGQILLTKALPKKFKAGNPLVVHLKIRNMGSSPWPAAGMLSQHLVRLMACIGAKTNPPCRAPFAPFLNDVMPGKSVTVDSLLRLPKQPGDYLLRIELEQIGVEKLSRCGTAPLVLPIIIPAAPSVGNSPLVLPRAEGVSP